MSDNRRHRETNEAAGWWLSVCSRPPHEISREDREAFTRWLRESPLHIAELLHVAHVHDSLARFRRWDAIPRESPASDDVVRLDLPARIPRKQFVRLSRWVLAATVAVAVIVAGLLVPATRGNAISTEVAERREVMLEDGSSVQLEPDTTLRVKMNATERRIEVENGRALFHVARDQRRPFRVMADGTEVQALGTTFGVEHRGSGVVITVAEGKVAVRPAVEHRGAVEEGVLLDPGEQVVVRGVRSPLSVRQVDAARALAWAEARLVFDAVPLSEVVAEFNRYNRGKLRLQDRELGLRSVSGVFQATDRETLIAFIRAGAGADVTASADGNDVMLGISPQEH